MAVTVDAKNKIRDLIKDNLDYGELGTDGDDVSEGDTDLGAGVSSTQKSLTVSVSNKTLRMDHRLLSSENNGTIFKEFGVKFTDGVLLDRVVFPDYEKTEDNELITIDILRVD